MRSQSVQFAKEIAMTEPQREHPERAAHLEGVLDELILKIMINLNGRGYSTTEILAALDNVCDARHRANDEDPDPAEDPD
jgi:hypothetical protein